MKEKNPYKLKISKPIDSSNLERGIVWDYLGFCDPTGKNPDPNNPKKSRHMENLEESSNVFF